MWGVACVSDRSDRLGADVESVLEAFPLSSGPGYLLGRRARCQHPLLTPGGGPH